VELIKVSTYSITQINACLLLTELLGTVFEACMDLHIYSWHGFCYTRDWTFVCELLKKQSGYTRCIMFHWKNKIQGGKEKTDELEF
jgi:hypothetical protein